MADAPTTTASVAPARRERAVEPTLAAKSAVTPTPTPVSVVKVQPKVIAAVSVHRVVSRAKEVAPMAKPITPPTSPTKVETPAVIVVAPDAVQAQSQRVDPPKKVAALPATNGVHVFSFQAAKDRVWLLLETPDGKGGRKRFREVIIRPHHSIEVLREDGVLFVTVGNAGAIKITYEGKTLYGFGKFGRRGTVIRHRKVEAPSKNAAETLSQ